MTSRQAGALQMEDNPLQKALENYQDLERQCHEARIEADSLRATNSALLSEIGMLRESFKAADAERMRWQATAATLLGRLYAINDTIGGAVRAAARDGLEAKEPEQQPKPAAEVAQRTEPVEPPKAAPEPEAIPAPPQAAQQPTPDNNFRAAMPVVDFGGPRQQ